MENPSALKELFKEFAQINRQSVYANQARIDFPSGEDKPLDLEISLMPSEGPFKGTCVKFSIKLPANYPRSAPTVRCLNRVFHPNVSTVGAVCFSMFSGDWNVSYRLEHYINGLLWFLANPNPDSALNSTCAVRNTAEFEKLVRSAAAGVSTRGKVYDNILMIDWSLPENVLRKFFDELQACKLSLNPFLACYSGALPALSWLKIAKGTPFDAEIVRLPGQSSATVRVRAKRLKVPEAAVMKEIILRVGDAFVLVLTRGPAKVSLARVASLMNRPVADVNLASTLDIANQLKLSHRSVPAFGHAETFAATFVTSFVDEDAQTPIFTATGVPSMLMKTNYAYIRPLLPQARVVHDLLEPVVVAATAPAPARAAVATPVAVVAPAATVAAPTPTPTPTAAVAVAVAAQVTPAAAAVSLVTLAPRPTTPVATVERALLPLLTFTPTAPAHDDVLVLRQQQRRPLTVST